MSQNWNTSKLSIYSYLQTNKQGIAPNLPLHTRCLHDASTRTNSYPDNTETPVVPVAIKSYYDDENDNYYSVCLKLTMTNFAIRN
jgi:hypothetical protein